MLSTDAPVYDIEVSEPVEYFIRNLYRADGEVVRAWLAKLARRDPQTAALVQRIRCESVPTYKVRIPRSHLPSEEWPTGLRIIFRVRAGDGRKCLVVIDLGDHDVSATHGLVSVYQDERQTA